MVMRTTFASCGGVAGLTATVFAALGLCAAAAGAGDDVVARPSLTAAFGATLGLTAPGGASFVCPQAPARVAPSGPKATVRMSPARTT